MFGFIKRVFLPKKEEPKLSVEEEYSKLKDALEKQKFYYKIINDFSYEDFDFSTFRKYVEESEYVTEYIRDKTLKRLNVIKPLFFFKDESIAYIIETVEFFLSSEAIVLEETLEHIKLIKQGEKLINDDLEDLNKKIEGVKEFIKNTKERFDNNVKNFEEIVNKNKE